jgi:broad specificity phosphatase PhoE
MRILILRHGETDADNEDRTLGWVDKALNPEGVVAAQHYASFLHRQQEVFDLIITSPLTRARQTALIISRELGSPMIENELIKERNFGELSGLTWAEFEKKYPELAKQNQPDLQEHLPKGESIPEVADRVVRFVHFLRQLQVGGKYPSVLVVTHTGIIRILLRQLLNYTPEETRELKITNLTAFTLEI